MAREFAIPFYNSKAWQDCREAYISTTLGGLCERCGDVGVEVHHKIYLSPDNINDPYITLSFDNLELLCQSCHSLEHNVKHDVVREDVKFNSEGELVSK